MLLAAALLDLSNDILYKQWKQDALRNFTGTRERWGICLWKAVRNTLCLLDTGIFAIVAFVPLVIVLGILTR